MAFMTAKRRALGPCKIPQRSSGTHRVRSLPKESQHQKINIKLLGNAH